jgi:hypothetical protein
MKMGKHHWRLMASLVLDRWAPLPGLPPGRSPNLTIEVLSSRPELVYRWRRALRISGTPEAPKVNVGANDVSGVFKSDQKGGWVGLVAGSRTAPISSSRRPRAKKAAVTITNHALNGTLFARLAAGAVHL